MTYIENPKTKGSGIICCIPQSGTCPVGCPECFFQSGRSYLEPLAEHLPNMPPVEMAYGRVVRVNDGNDSCHDFETVVRTTSQYPMKFYNTSMYANCLPKFPAPVVLTVNPGKKTDTDFHEVDPIPKNLMMVRARTNTWNLDLVDKIVEYYSQKEIPIILTFMAYHNEDSVPVADRGCYTYRKRTTNPYYAIKTDAWRAIMGRYEDNMWVYSCGKIEGERGMTGCRRCGNCLREYFATMERMRT